MNGRKKEGRRKEEGESREGKVRGKKDEQINELGN